MDEPRVGIVLEVLYRAYIEGLAKVVSYSRVYSEWKNLFSNKIFIFYGKLQEEVKDRSKH